MIDSARFGIAVGHATDEAGGTGLTVIRGAEGPFRASGVIIGRASATRELAVLQPEHLVDRVDAILLTGGSAYGLDACAGVMRWMEERGRGFRVGGGVVPIVPAAAIFDLAPCGRFDARPTPDMAYEACDKAGSGAVIEGSVGAGTGATVGKALGPASAMKGGVGLGFAEGSGLAIMAIAVVNALGDVCDGAGRIVAGARGPNGFANSERVLGAGSAGDSGFAELATGNTTLAIVAVSAPLTRIELSQLARAASAALLRRIRPCGTTFDGDVIVAIAPLSGSPAQPLRAEVLAVAALEEAVERSVRRAHGRDGIPGLADGPRT